MPVKWKRSCEGFVDSHCGVWAILPLYCGCVDPQCYELRRNGKRVGTWFDTQTDAKHEAYQVTMRGLRGGKG